MTDTTIREARGVLRAASFGLLSTISRRHGGWPFGSIAPYALSRRGQPVLLIASIAEHTKNITADERVSLMAFERATDGDDPQAQGRLTLLGRARPVEGEDERRDAAARYAVRVPSAPSYSETHDFEWYEIEVEQARFIGGFGKIFWLDAARLRTDPLADPLREQAAAICEHMNEDHRDALSLLARAFRGVDAATASMVGVDAFGFDVECTVPEVRLRFEFDRPADPGSVRTLTVALVQRARLRLTGETTA